MAKVLNKGYVTTDETSLVTSAVGFDYAANFAVKSDSPGEARIVNTTTPIDRPETLRFAYSEIKDVYANTSIDTSAYASSRKGVQVLVQLTDVYALTDDTDASYRVDLPVSAHLVIKLPANENISSADVLGLANRLVGGLYDNQVVNSDRISALLRGSLLPTSM